MTVAVVVFIADFEYPLKWRTCSADTVWFSVTWLVPRETAAVPAPSVYTIRHHVTSLDATATFVGCMHLPPALLAERPGPFTCGCGNTGVKRTPK